MKVKSHVMRDFHHSRLPVFASAAQERGGRLNHKSTLPEEDDCQSESNSIDCTLSKTLGLYNSLAILDGYLSKFYPI